jgi:hypothetical protein
MAAHAQEPARPRRIDVEERVDHRPLLERLQIPLQGLRAEHEVDADPITFPLGPGWSTPGEGEVEAAADEARARPPLGIAGGLAKDRVHPIRRGSHEALVV